MPANHFRTLEQRRLGRLLAGLVAVAGIAGAGLATGCAGKSSTHAEVIPAATPPGPAQGASDAGTDASPSSRPVVVTAEHPDFVTPTVRANVPPPIVGYVNPPIDQRYMYQSVAGREMDPSVVDNSMDQDLTIVDPVGEAAKRAFIEATLSYERGTGDKALASYLDAVKKDPENFWIKNRAAMAALEVNNLSTAERLAKEVLKADPKNYEAMLILAMHALLRDDLPTGTQWLENVLVEKPRNLKALVMLARIAAEQERDPEKTKVYCARILEIERNLEALLWYAEANAMTGEITDAADLYRQVVRYRPGLINRLLEMAQRLEAQNRPADALELYRQAVLMQPTNELARLQWERAIEEQQGTEALLTAYEQLAKEHPLDLNLQELVAGFYARTKLYDELKAQRARMLDVEPRHIPSLLSLGRLALEQGDRDTATQYFEKAISAGPTQARVYRDIALLYLDNGNVERASELLGEAALFDPNDAETVLALAGLAEQQDDPRKTELLLKRAIDLLPGNGRMLKMLGDFYRREEKYDLASQLYEQAIATTPDDFQAQVVLAILYMELGNDRGLDLIQTNAPRAMTNDEPFYVTYGALALEFGYWERALWSYQKAIDENKIEIRHKIGRARALLHLERPDEAFGGLRAAINELPADNELRKAPIIALSSLLQEVGRKDEAARELEPLAAGMREDFEVRALYVEALAEAHRPEAATELEAVKADFATTHEDETKMLQARVLRHGGDFDGALAVLRPMVEADPNDLQARFELALTYSETKDLTKTEESYRYIIDHAGDRGQYEGLVLNAYNNLAYVWSVENVRLEEAEKLAAEALDRAPRADYVLDTMGSIKLRLGDYEEAEKFLTKSARLSLGDSEIFENLGDLYRATNRPTEAMEQYRRAIGLSNVAADVRERLQGKITELEAHPKAAPSSTTTTSANN